MKTKDFIKALSEADPSGELECSVGNIDIHFVDVEPVYWDGYLQKLTRDESKSPYYNIVGASYGGGEAQKVVIHTLSIEDAIDNDPDLPIDYSHLSEATAERYKKYNDKEREMILKIQDDIEKSYFFEWVNKQMGREEDNKFKKESTDLLYTTLDLKRTDPLAKNVPEPDGKGNTWHQSYHQRRLNGWTNTIELDVDNSGQLTGWRSYIPGEENSS